MPAATSAAGERRRSRSLGGLRGGERGTFSPVAGVTSAKDLAQDGLTAFLGECQRIGGFKNMSPGKPYGTRRPGMMSPQAIAKAKHLWREYTGGTGTEQGLRTFVAKFGVSDLRFADFSTGQRLLAALAEMASRRNAEGQEPPAA